MPSGIGGVGKSRQEHLDSQPSGGGLGLELWLKDGDSAIVSSAASGDEDDDRLGDFYSHGAQATAQSGKPFWYDKPCALRTADLDGDDCVFCAAGERARHKFGLWVYVHKIYHSSKFNDAWVPEVLPSGEEKYVETVNDYMMFSQGFGQKEYLWENLVELYSKAVDDDEPGLKASRIQIRRAGSGMNDTKYVFRSLSTKKYGEWEGPEVTESGRVRDELGSPLAFFVAKAEAVENPRESSQEEAPVKLADVPSGTVDAAPWDDEEGDDDGDLF